MNWLAWAGYEEELMDLTQAVALPLVAAPNGFGGSFAIEWVLLREYFPFFEVRDSSLEAAGNIRQAHQTLLPPGDKPVTLTRIHTILHTVGQMPRGWVKDKPPKDKNTYLNDVHWDFVGYLHWEKRCGWVKAIYLAQRWQDYFFRDDKAQNPFDLGTENLEVHLVRRCRRFFHLKGALALSFLQAMVHYADYLAYHQAPTPQTRDQVLESCRALYAKAAKAVEGGDSSLRLYPSLEEQIEPVPYPDQSVFLFQPPGGNPWPASRTWPRSISITSRPDRARPGIASAAGGWAAWWLMRWPAN